MKPIRLSHHARERLAARGTTEEEVVEEIRTGARQPAELGRLECRKVFRFNRLWNGRRYATKEVRPIFADERNATVVVTVYVYYR